MKKNVVSKLRFSKKTVIRLSASGTAHVQTGVHAAVTKTRAQDCTNTCTQGCTNSVCTDRM